MKTNKFLDWINQRLVNLQVLQLTSNTEQKTPHNTIILDSDGGKVKSDGGRSSYYDIYLTPEQIKRVNETGRLQVDDIILSGFGNDFDFGTMLKSMKRAYEDMHGGGKEGASAEYNLKKIDYSNNQVKKRL